MLILFEYFELIVDKLAYVLSGWEVFLDGSNGNMALFELLGDNADILNATLR